ncbi:glycosyltransferase [Methylobacterium sp. E-005]|uniref:glycosyltransferase n=1 Tax=Methylobacterium sp. E-005 TaxID=2836549 RepID=UPI001FB86CA0|nr:glycosyltransferase [Methylobacterium sp. E-005]MCJ2088797.1 glycosyltransferase [Methylobacterium sp. E-005]
MGAVLLLERGGGDWLTSGPYHVLRSAGERGVPFQRASAALPPEIAFLRTEGVAERLLIRTAADAAQAGTDAATALLNAGLMEEAAYYRALARALGAPYLDGSIPFGPGLCFPGTVVSGLAMLAPGSVAPWVLAPRGRVIAALLDGRRPAGPAAITSPTHLREAVFAAIPAQVADYAAHDRARCAPERATAREPAVWRLLVLALVSIAGLCLCAALPAPIAGAVVLAAQSLFLAMTTVRLAAVAIAAPVTVEVPPLTDAALPVYTILVPLYREAAVVPALLRALAALDYPPAKLDIKLLIEAGDPETAAVLAPIPLPARFEVITVPPGTPRTKPRALNAGLPLARGNLLTVFDAEDDPDPGQLRLAAALFARLPERTACLQGRLVIDNADDSWLTRAYALEYAGLFDVLNPALAQCRLPVPLGGTSMHLRGLMEQMHHS